jgi:hypothetical protein
MVHDAYSDAYSDAGDAGDDGDEGGDGAGAGGGDDDDYDEHACVTIFRRKLFACIFTFLRPNHRVCVLSQFG